MLSNLLRWLSEWRATRDFEAEAIRNNGHDHLFR